MQSVQLGRLQNPEAECIGESWRNLGVEIKKQKCYKLYKKENKKEKSTKQAKCLDGGDNNAKISVATHYSLHKILILQRNALLRIKKRSYRIMRKSVLMSAAKKAQITLAAMAVCSMTIWGAPSVFAENVNIDGNGNIISGNGATVDATGQGIIAIGTNVNAKGSGSVALGWNASALSDNTVAIGFGATAEGSSASAFGSNARANNMNAVAFGSGAMATGMNAAALGFCAQAQAESAIAIGHMAMAAKKDTLALGMDAHANKNGSTSIGSGSQATEKNATAFGFGAKALAESSIAIGDGSRAMEMNTVSFGDATNTSKNKRLVNLLNGQENTDAATYGQIITDIKKSADGSKIEFYTGKTPISATWSVDLPAAGASLTQEEFNRMLEANNAFTNLKTDVGNKANVKGDNITTGAGSAWAEKLGTGVIENGNNNLVTGGTVYDKLGAGESGNYIMADNTVNANLKALDKQVKTKADAIAKNKADIGDTTKLTAAGLKSDNLSDAVVEVNNKVGTSSEIKVLNDAGLGDNLAQATDAVNKKAEANKAAVERLDSRVNVLTDRVDAIGNTVSQLDSKVNKVGAGAAALAALHPLDFDPDNKLTFSAGVGNYRGENAAAIGAFYRPDEHVMFSLAGNMGNGENMINAGISFALDRTAKTTTSKAAMARRIAVQDAKIAEQEREIAAQKNDIAELKAMVAQLSAKVK